MRRHGLPRPAWVAMMFVVLSVAVAGCTDSKPTPVVNGTCPAWVLGQGVEESTYIFPSGPKFNSTDKQDDIGQGFQTFRDYPLDRVELDFHADSERAATLGDRGIEVADGVLSLTASRAGGGPIEPYNPFDPEGAKSTWTWDAGVHQNFSLYLDLTSPAGPTDPGRVLVDWHFDRNLDGSDETPDHAAASYTARFWYRTC